MIHLQRPLAFATGIIACVIAGLLCGCHRSAQIPATPAEIQSTIQTAFKDGDPKAKAMANDVVAALQNQKTSEAFMGLNALSTAPGLTEEQRIAAARSKAAISRELRAQADKGDAEAAKILQLYQMTR
ncbi:MAG: hypothetical protein ACYDH9_03665 [Limisphaerales bacterium]